MINRAVSSLFTIFIFTLLVSACEQERPPCLEPRTVSLRVGCYTFRDTSTIATDSLLPNANFGAMDEDTLKFLYYGANKISKFGIILSALSDSCTWLLQPDSAASPIDTITFYYNRKLQFLSNACGYTYFFSVNSINTTHHNIDSVKINNADVTSNANSAEHVKIYF